MFVHSELKDFSIVNLKRRLERIGNSNESTFSQRNFAGYINRERVSLANERVGRPLIASVGTRLAIT